MVIYRAVNKINWMGYIGQTILSLEERMDYHYYEKRNLYFHNALRYYGFDNFFWYIICYCSSKQEMDEKEKYYIKYFESKFPNGYNLTDGGEGNFGWHPTEEAKQKNREAHLGKPSGKKGKKQPATSGENNPAKRPDVRAKISAKRSGQKLGPPSEEARENLRKALIGKKRPPFSEEWKKNLSKARAGKIPWNKGKKLGPEYDETRKKMSIAKIGNKNRTGSKIWKP